MVRYSGLLNKNNIIKYDRYSDKLNNNNPFLKKYKNHLKSFDDDIYKEEQLERERNERRQNIISLLLGILCILICITIIALGIIFPSFGWLLLEIIAEGLSQSS